MKDETRLVHARAGKAFRRTVNPAVEHASTVLLENREQLYHGDPTYARMGLEVHRELETALGEIENAAFTRLTNNGLQACSLAIGSLVVAGDHVLVADSAYGPTPRFCSRRLTAMGVSATRFAPTIEAGIAELIEPNTKLIVLESPGSLTFDVMDTPAIAEIAKSRGVITIMDNTWGAGVLHKPLDLGVDVSVQALTKYAVGHADALGGAVMTNRADLYDKIAKCADDWGISLGPDDAYNALRGLRTLPVRLRQHEANGYKLADWLAARPEVAFVLHPGRPDHPEHALWQRDFTGANGLFGFVFQEISEPQLDAFLEALNLFAMGFSWGGFESLLIPCCQQLRRLPEDRIHKRPGPLMRVHAGLEHADDLIADLDQALAVMANAASD